MTKLAQGLPLPMFSDMGGQGSPAPAEGGQGAAPAGGKAAGEPAAPFYTYTGDDGQAIDFATPDDLGRHIREGTLRHADYQAEAADGPGR